MKQWLTAREIADEALPYLPTNERNVQKLAARECWNDHPDLVRQRTGRGGGLEYHVDILPTLAQVAYKQKFISVGAANDEADASVDDEMASDGLSAVAQQQRDARLAIVRAYHDFSKGLSNLGQAARVQVFTDRYQMGAIMVEEWVRRVIPSFSKRSLNRWCSVVRQGKSKSLAVDRSRSRKGTSLLDSANDGKVRSFILALIAQNPHIAAERIRVLCQDEFGRQLVDRQGRSVPMPAVRTFQHTLKRLKTTEKVALTQLSNPDFYRSTMAPAGVGALRHVTRPNALWQIDASPLDAMDTEISRPTVYACLDIATRQTVIYISRTPKASAVALLLRKAIMAWGVPDKIKTDNGSDFIASATKRLLDSLGVELELSAPYSPQQKGHVERVIGTFQRHFAEMLPGYVGHNPADRKEIEDRQSFAKRLGAPTAEVFGVSMNLAEIQRRADEWVDIKYQHSPHSGLNGKSPFQVASESAAPVRRVDVRALDMLLMPVAGKGGYRTVGKHGVKVDKFYYHTAKALPGDHVLVRMDQNDLGLAYVFDADDGRYIEPVVCPELAGIDPAEFLRITKKVRAAELSDRSKDVREEIKRLTTGAPLIERYLREKAKDVPNVLALPKRTIEHTTPELDAALHAATGERPQREEDQPLDFSTSVPDATVVSFQPKPTVPGERPRFQTDMDMAAWLIGNPDKITDGDRVFMADRLKNWTFRELLSGANVDPEALLALVKPNRKSQEAI